ncbi:MAG: exosortase system-associated protein, TIGR04073 family [Verrucomicrobiota bacterium]|nr:exosortase system-associated protein, TIGR04073 family [Verrucomicrobiota bacterium]
MRSLATMALLLGFAFICRADIQDPPSNQQGPTRRLGRGISNVLFGWSELPDTIGKVNQDEGNSAAAGYGVVRGIGRSVMRIQAGVFEILTFPFPAVRGSYYPVLESDTHWIHSGYKEFPPELGNESKYPYVRHY